MMIIYEATKQEFLTDAFNNQLIDKICDSFSRNNLKANPNEFGAWDHSVQDKMFKILSNSLVPDDAGIAIEFKVPLTSKRVDFMISGYDEQERGRIIIIELKQWAGENTSRVDDKDGIVKTFYRGGIKETTHPSYQAWSYCSMIQSYNEYVQSGMVDIQPCAYLHNFENKFIGELDNECYAHYVSLAPLYLKEDALKLKEFIERTIRKGDNKKHIYEIVNGKLKPSKSLQDSIFSMLKGNQEFLMIDAQKVIFEKANKLVRESQIDGKKRVIIIEGGPGTGKSVVAIHLLAKCIEKNLFTHYISKNSAPRNVYHAKLKGNMKTQEINHLFRGSGTFVDAKTDTFPVLIVDEAHRLNEKSGFIRNMGENQVKEIINAARCSIFFIDEDQKIDVFDIGSKETIRKFAKQLGVEEQEIYQYELDSQFRCNGSDGYLAWLDDVLEIRESANSEGFSMDYEIKVFDDPTKMRIAIEEKNENNKSRIVAGYCWVWVSEGKNKSDVYDILIGENFKMSWNLGNTGTWAIDKDSINEAGCIHTCQGLEFDYVGVIIGEDLIYKERVETDYTKRAKTDQSLKGIKKLAETNREKALKDSERIIKNTYRTLMTRGLKGCYIYCCDKNLENYLKQRIERLSKKTS